MLASNPQSKTVRVIFSVLIAMVLAWGLVACNDRIETPQTLDNEALSTTESAGRLSEVAPPVVIQQLNQDLEAYQPQVKILSPSPDQILQDTTVSARFQVQDLPIFKNSDLGMGPHLHVILDNQPYIPVYDLEKPLIFEDLAPGTHALRVFASRPWHESFKNEGAYAQTTFHLFTKSAENNPSPNLPLLTYSRPQGSYGAEPIMLDFYLSNAPLHLVAQENAEDDIADWRIRVTANGQSFVIDRWQPVYLQGFQPGKNWVKLEFLDEQGNPVKNVFNNTVRLISYEPNGKDTLARLVRGELSAKAARGIIDPNYKPEPIPTPSPEVAPTPLPSPTVSPTPEPTPIPSVVPPVEEKPTAELESPEEILTPVVEPATPAETPTAQKETPEKTVTPSAEPVSSEATQTNKLELEGIFNRFSQKILGIFRSSDVAPQPEPELQEELPTPSPTPVVIPEEAKASAIPNQSLTSEEKSIPVDEAPALKSLESETAKSEDVLNDSQISTPEPAAPNSGLPPTLPEIIETPFPQPLEP